MRQKKQLRPYVKGSSIIISMANNNIAKLSHKHPAMKTLFLPYFVNIELKSGEKIHIETEYPAKMNPR